MMLEYCCNDICAIFWGKFNLSIQGRFDKADAYFEEVQ
jgi:hypothetical protein